MLVSDNKLNGVPKTLGEIGVHIAYISKTVEKIAKTTDQQAQVLHEHDVRLGSLETWKTTQGKSQEKVEDRKLAFVAVLGGLIGSLITAIASWFK